MSSYNSEGPLLGGITLVWLILIEEPFLPYKFLALMLYHVSTTALKTHRLPSISAGHTKDLMRSERRSRPSLEKRTCFSGFISTEKKIISCSRLKGVWGELLQSYELMSIGIFLQFYKKLTALRCCIVQSPSYWHICSIINAIALSLAILREILLNEPTVVTRKPLPLNL